MVRPVLETYCDRLDDPQVVAMRERYRALDHPTVVAQVVDELVAEGKLQDSDQFTIEAVCGPRRPRAGTLTTAHGAPAQALASGPPPIPDAGARPMTELIVEEEQTRRRRALGLLGLQVGQPQIFAASLGVMAASQPTSYDCRSICRFRGPFAKLEPGIGGGKLSAGWGYVSGSTGKRDHFLSRTYLAMGIKATVLRTWGNGGVVEPGHTYTGVEYEFSIVRLNFNLGVLYRIDDDAGYPWLFSWGVGWGF